MDGSVSGEAGEAELFPRIVARSMELLQESRREAYAPVINGTGVLLHTNLGRAPFLQGLNSPAYLALEFDLESGKRGQRLAPIRERIARVCGAEDAVMVNNNAASLLLILQALAVGRAVVSTSLGCEGYPLVADRELVVADEPTDFAREVVALLRDPARRAELGAAGQRFAAERYDWSVIAPLLEEAYRRLVV